MSTVSPERAVHQAPAAVPFQFWPVGLGPSWRSDWRFVLGIGPRRQVSVQSVQSHFLYAHDCVSSVLRAVCARLLRRCSRHLLRALDSICFITMIEPVTMPPKIADHRAPVAIHAARGPGR